MKCILLFGAGKSATVLIDYLKKLATEKVCNVMIADADAKLLQAKAGKRSGLKTVQLNIADEAKRKELVQQADVVISLLPPDLHYQVALDCVLFHKHLLTASYVDDKIRQLTKDIEHRNLLFLCEMGLDPGIDHMSAMQLINNIQSQGGTITSFKSHCGGLIAPESDDNPWHYKISWNPRNVINAGKAGAVYKQDNKEVHADYEALFSNNKTIDIPELGLYAYYPNRDSLSYAPLYNLDHVQTFIRTTLRHPEFCFGWKNIIHLKLTDEQKIYDTDGLTIAQFFREHFDKNGFSNWLTDMLMTRLNYVKEMMEKLTKLIDAETEAKENDDDIDENFLVVNENGELNSIDVNNVKDSAAETVAAKMHEANLAMKQLFFLGIDDHTLINKGICSAADVLQFIIERKLALQPNDKDMVVMLHEIAYTVKRRKYQVKSCLTVKGDNSLHTAMAKTVGLPLGIAAKLILEGKITDTGLRIPITPSIYEPVLKELETQGIKFNDTVTSA